MLGSLRGLGGGCLRGDGNPELSSRLTTECRDRERQEGASSDCSRLSTAKGKGPVSTGLEALLSSALKGERGETKARK